ncbi:MAG TPA: nucleotidyltransferase domain-containing protein [Ktedonobacteraceae bacterium]|nr:nucleotidyltransferase domain-containing protein [Ktedonobacteraceae bacterium]
MPISQPYTGTPQHQKLLQTIVSHYADDPRVLAIIVFGSLGRGNWDPYSDLDLDIIIGDDVQIHVLQELEHLFHPLPDSQETVALVIPHGEESADIVFASLLELSVRYHALMSTSPNIVESMRVLGGRIDEATIKAAGIANQQAKELSAGQLLDMCVRYALETDIALQRRQLWVAIELLHRIRGHLMELFARSHENPRPLYAFQKGADPVLQRLLGSATSQYDLGSIQKALLNLLDILEYNLGQFSGGQTQLTAAQWNIIQQVRERQRNRNLNSK